MVLFLPSHWSFLHPLRALSSLFLIQAFVYNLRTTFKFLHYLFDLTFLPRDGNVILDFLVREYLPGLWNSLVNLLMYLIFDKISRYCHNVGLWRNYTEYMSKEKFINRVSFIYLCINVIFVPMFSLAAGQDIVNLAESVILWKAYNKSFLLGDSCRLLLTQLSSTTQSCS